MNRMQFLYEEAPPPKANWAKFGLQITLTVAVLTFCAVLLLH